MSDEIDTSKWIGHGVLLAVTAFVGYLWKTVDKGRDSILTLQLQIIQVQKDQADVKAGQITVEQVRTTVEDVLTKEMAKRDNATTERRQSLIESRRGPGAQTCEGGHAQRGCVRRRIQLDGYLE